MEAAKIVAICIKLLLNIHNSNTKMYKCCRDHPPKIKLEKKAVLATSLMIQKSFIAISHTAIPTKFNAITEKMVC